MVDPPMTADRGVSNCYVFKSRLQEYAQKVCLPTPVYETVKEGPSHEPVFKSSVIVNDVRYDSLPGFFNRKAAEQSAAEIALIEILKAGEKKECIPTLHETGLCKNMLQEYAQKMNYAIPSYLCSKLPSGPNLFICTVEIGEIQYIGAAAKTKKEAEIKAARTALLAIQSSEGKYDGSSNYTVLPAKSKRKESETQAGAVKNLKPKKPLKKKWTRRKFMKKKDVKLHQDNEPTEAEHSCTVTTNEAGRVEDSILVDGNNQGAQVLLDNYALPSGVLVISSKDANGLCQDALTLESNCNGSTRNNPEALVNAE